MKITSGRSNGNLHIECDQMGDRFPNTLTIELNGVYWECDVVRKKKITTLVELVGKKNK